MNAAEIRVYVDRVCSRTNADGTLNAQHVALESTLRERHGLASWIAEFDGPGRFYPDAERISAHDRGETHMAEGLKATTAPSYGAAEAIEQAPPVLVIAGNRLPVPVSIDDFASSQTAAQHLTDNEDYLSELLDGLTVREERLLIVELDQLAAEHERRARRASELAERVRRHAHNVGDVNRENAVAASRG